MLHTIGYEGSNLRDFLGTLIRNDIEVLFDVRDRAQSRKRGFSKTPLSTALSEVGISYVHLRELGDPREGRLAARAKEWIRFREIYAAVIASRPAKDALARLIDISSRANVAIMCFERDHCTCHRHIIAMELASALSAEPKHLEVQILDGERSMRHYHQSAAA